MGPTYDGKRQWTVERPYRFGAKNAGTAACGRGMLGASPRETLRSAGPSTQSLPLVYRVVAGPPLISSGPERRETGSSDRLAAPLDRPTVLGSPPGEDRS